MKLLTNSEMSQWRRCKRKWYLSTYRKLTRINETAENFNGSLGIGNRVHDALAAYYDPEDVCRDPTLHVAVTRARDLEKYGEDHAEAINKECDTARVMLEGYMEWLAETGADQALRFVEAEKAVTAPLGYLDTHLLSKLDARVDHEEFGGRYALEHKTVSTIKPPAHLKFATQFLTEHLVEFLDLRERGEDESRGAVGVLWNALLKSKRTARAKGPFYHREPVRHSVDQLRSHWRHVVAIAKEIHEAETLLAAGESHHFVCHPNPTNDCSWDCPFSRQCLLLDVDENKAESALQTQFRVGDPLARYAGLL